MLFDHLEGCDSDGCSEGDATGKRYGDIYICIAELLYYKAETKKKSIVPEITIHNTTLAPKYRNTSFIASNVNFTLKFSN